MPKRFYNLYHRITHFDNLYSAFRKAAKGKRGLPNVADFEFNLESNLFDLQGVLESQSYRPGEYYSFYIRDPKLRLISAAPFHDRVVHHGLCNILEPIFERTFIGDSYANRVGKGTHAALDRAQCFARQYKYILQCDIQQFFPSVDHTVLRTLFVRKIGDPQALWLCEQILSCGSKVLENEYTMTYFPADDLFAANRPRGLPIGNLTSQFWANVYLNELDQFIKRELHARAYLRYVDDYLLFSDDKRQLWDWKVAIRDNLNSLRLTLHERSSTVYPVTNGIPFLGFRLYPTHRRLKRRNGIAFQRRYQRLLSQYNRGEITLEKLHQSIQGWIAHARHGNTYGLRQTLFEYPIPPVFQ